MTLEEDTRRLIALNLLSRSTGSFGDRAKRRFEKTREELGEKLKSDPKRKLPENSGLILRLEFGNERITNSARKVSLAIYEFSQKYPEYGKKLQELIDQHRQERRGYLLFGGQVSDEIYVEIVQELMGKASYKEASRVYDSIMLIRNYQRSSDTEPKSADKSLLSE